MRYLIAILILLSLPLPCRAQDELLAVLRISTEALKALDGANEILERDDLGDLPTIGPVDGKCWISSDFGWRNRPRREEHPGRDYAARVGTPVIATGGGWVIVAGRGRGWGGYGNIVVIAHSFDARHNPILITIYAHMDRILVVSGMRVERGTRLGTVGSTGYSTGPHLHYEVRVKGVPEDPGEWIL